MSTTVTIGKVSARPGVKTFMSVIPISCFNTGGSRVREMVAVTIDEPESVLLNLDYNTTLPVQIAFLNGIEAPSTSLCREVELDGGERVNFDLPINVWIRVASPDPGHYQMATPVTARGVSAQTGSTGACP